MKRDRSGGTLSRRAFTALVAGTVVARAGVPSVRAAQSITASALLERIKTRIGVEWRPETIDGIKAGDPATAVKGVVTTSMATLDVLQRAVKAGANVVVTALPTFYSRADAATPAAGRGGAPAPPDRVFAAKRDFIAANNLVVVRLSDHWRLRSPDPRLEGTASALGWTGNGAFGAANQFNVSELTLDALAATVKKAFQSRGGIRVVGDPQARVQRVGLLPGTTPIQAALELLPQVDVIIAGEVREWESVEYARDVVFSGQKRGLILVGRVVSEEPGMAACAAWLKTFTPEVSVQHLAAGDPYWRPTA